MITMILLIRVITVNPIHPGSKSNIEYSTFVFFTIHHSKYRSYLRLRKIFEIPSGKFTAVVGCYQINTV